MDNKSAFCSLAKLLVIILIKSSSELNHKLGGILDLAITVAIMVFFKVLKDYICLHSTNFVFYGSKQLLLVI